MNIGHFTSLRLKKEIFQTNKNGQIVKNDLVTIKFFPNTTSCKVAFIIKKKMGNAIVRNTIKRRFREILRAQKTLSRNFFCLIIPKFEIVDASFDDIKKNTQELLTKILK